MSEADKLADVTERMRKEVDRMKRVNKKAEQENGNSMAADKANGESKSKDWTFVSRIILLILFGVTIKISHPEFTDFEYGITMMAWLIWIEIYFVNVRIRE